MNGVLNYAQTNVPSAVATGLSGLNQSGSLFSAAFWHYDMLGSSVMWQHTDDNGAAMRNGLAVRSSANSLRLSIATATAVTNVTSTRYLVIPRRWRHYALTYDGVHVMFYVNGSFEERVAATAAPGAAGTRVTGIGNAVIGGLGGKLWDLRVFPNKTLNPAEIRATMDPRRTVDGCLQRLFREWTPGASVPVFDLSGNGNNLTTSATVAECDTAEAAPWAKVLAARPAYAGKAPAAATGWGMLLGGHRNRLARAA